MSLGGGSAILSRDVGSQINPSAFSQRLPVAKLTKYITVDTVFFGGGNVVASTCTGYTSTRAQRNFEGKRASRMRSVLRQGCAIP